MSEQSSVPDSAAPDPGGAARRHMVLVTCCLALFISTLDNTVANVALPSIGRDLHASTSALQWVVDGYIVVRGALLFNAGALGDRYGRRRLLQAGLVVFGIGSLFCSLAPTVGLLIGARVLQALGGCFLVPSSAALITQAYPERRQRAQALGIWSATTGVSTGLGPPLGGLLVDTLGWRSVFWINLPIVVVAVILAARYATESTGGNKRRLDLTGQGLMIVVLVALTSGFIEASGGDWLSPAVLGLFALAVVALGAFLVVENRVDEPLLAPSLFRNRSFSGAAIVATLAFFIFTGFLFVNTLYLQQIRGYSPLVAGLLVMPTTIGNVVLAPLSGRLTASRGPRLPVLLAGISMLAGTIMLSFTALNAPIPVLLVAYALVGSGIGLVNTPITSAAVAGLPDERAGVGGAVTSTFRQVGSSVGVALLGSLAFTGFISALPGQIAALHLPAARAARIVAAARASAASGGIGQVTTVPRATAAVGAAFVDGMHLAFPVAAGGAALIIATALLAFRQLRSPAPRAVR